MRDSSADDVLFFAVLANASSLTRAARELGVSVPSVSKRLARLEERLGVRLIERSTRRLALTSEGERYAAGGAQIARELDDLEDSLAERGELSGRIRLRAPLGLGRHHIGPLIAEFSVRHPGVRVELELSPVPVGLVDMPFDVAIHVGAARDSRLAIKRLAENRRLLCASPDYLREHGTPQTVDDLAGHDCIVLRQDDGDYALWRFGADDDPIAVRVDGTLVGNDGEVTTQWCVRGRGLIMRSSWHVAPLIRDGTLVHVLPDVPTPRADIHAVYAAGARLPRRIREIVAHLADGLPPRLDVSRTG